MADTNNKIIRQISTDANNTYDIAAKYLTDVSGNDYTYESINQTIGSVRSELLDIAHGVIDTYVIKSSANTDDNENIYTTIVKSTKSILENVNVDDLDTLVSPSRPENVNYHVGDIILMEEVSDDTKTFDRWISAVNGNTVNLAVLETQVATHHHTINVPTVSSASTKVLTSATVNSTTTSNMAYAGSDVTVVTGVINSSAVVITSISYDNNESYDLKIETGTSQDYGHTHTVNSHNHTVTYDKTIVSSTANVYTALSTSSYTPHTHAVASVAGEATEDETIEYVTSAPKSTATFIKTLTDDSKTTNTGGATPETDGVSLTTSTQTSDDTIGDIVSTKSSGEHSHDVTMTTVGNVVTSVSVAAKVVTSVSYNAAITVNSWTATVDTSGILSFNVSTEDRISSITVPTRTEQSIFAGKVTLSGIAASAGAHKHGFSHTHTIEPHSHTVNDHTHTYLKTVAGTSESAITSLNTSSYITHKHINTTVAGTSKDSTPISYVYDGDKTTTVVKDLTTLSVSASVKNASPKTNNVYQKITGTITHPGINVSYTTLLSMLNTGTVKPAVDSEQKPVMSITTSSTDVVESITVGTSLVNTYENEGGE